MTPLLLVLILAIMVYYGYRAKDLLKSQLETAHLLKSSLELLAADLEPKFTCYYCNNKFPLSAKIQIDRYSYCKEHAQRGHSA